LVILLHIYAQREVCLLFSTVKKKIAVIFTSYTIIPSQLTAMLHQCWDFSQKCLVASQIDFIRLRKSALASLQSGNKKLALNYARELKLVTQSREKCSSLLNRVEEVLSVIADAESTKKV